MRWPREWGIKYLNGQHFYWNLRVIWSRNEIQRNRTHFDGCGFRRFFNQKILFPIEKMKIFQTIRGFCEILGISSENQSIAKYPFNERELLGFTIFACCVVSQFLYIFHVANGFMEYMGCICVTFGNIIIFISFVDFVFKKTLLFHSFDNIENLIDASKWLNFIWFWSNFLQKF